MRTPASIYKGGAAPVKSVALTHTTINLVVVALYATNIWLLTREPSAKDTSLSTPVLLSIIGVALLCVSGWLGSHIMHGWHRYLGDAGDVIGVDRLCASAPGETELRQYRPMSAPAPGRCCPDIFTFNRSHPMSTRFNRRG